MDNEVEMVNAGSDSHEVLGPDDLDEIPTRIPAEKGRRKVCVFCTISILFAIGAAAVGTIYLNPDLLTAANSVYTPDKGVVGNDVDNAKEAVAVAEAEGTAIEHEGHDATSEFVEHHGLDKQKEKTQDEKVQNWLDAKITLKDGKKYEVLKRMTHATDAFTEGLTFSRGRLFESTGLNRRSTVRELDPRTGEVMNSYPMKPTVFAEGLTVMHHKLVQLTYKKNEGYVYSMDDLSTPEREFTFSTTTNEGWGLTYDKGNDRLIVSDGSKYLHFWETKNFTETHKVKVIRQNDKSAHNINELEFWRNRVLANVWYEDTILVINPETGIVEKEYDFSDLWPKAERKQQKADVLNGISVVGNQDQLLVTGKNWDRMFRIRLLP